MKTQSTSICSAAHAAVALIPGLLRHLAAQGFRMANSSEELLDLFEEKYSMDQDRNKQTDGDESHHSGSPCMCQ
jgi:hypothetical protein